MNPLMKRLFNSVRDGLFIVSPEGKTRYANMAALRLIPCNLGASLPNEPLQRLIAGVSAGHIPLPHQADIELGADCLEAGADRIRADLLHSPVGSDYVVLLHNITAEEFYRTGVKNLASLVEKLHREDLSTLSENISNVLRRMEAGIFDEMPDNLETLKALMLVAQQQLSAIDKLGQLAELSGIHSVEASDRIDLTQSLLLASQKLRTLAQSRSMRVVIEKPDFDPPPVYGSAIWINRIIEELLENALKHGRISTDVTIHFNQNASFLLLTFRNAGKALPSTLQNRIFDEGFRGKHARDNKLAGLGLGLAICRQVIALHGGHLSEGNPGDDSIEFSIELPTGAPQNDSAQLDLVQAQRYAQDLARLMQRKRAAAITG